MFKKNVVKKLLKFKAFKNEEIVIVPDSKSTLIHSFYRCSKIGSGSLDAKRYQDLTRNKDFSECKLISFKELVTNDVYCKECFENFLLVKKKDVKFFGFSNVYSLLAETQFFFDYMESDDKDPMVVTYLYFKAFNCVNYLQKAKFTKLSKVFMKELSKKDEFLKEILRKSFKNKSLQKRCSSFLKAKELEEYLPEVLLADDTDDYFPPEEDVFSKKKLKKNEDKFVLFSSVQTSYVLYHHLTPSQQIHLTFNLKEEEFSVLPYLYFNAYILNDSQGFDMPDDVEYVIVDTVPSQEVLETCRGLYDVNSTGPMGSYKEVLKAANLLH